jgi:molybdopterin molybdotransferase/putative molybdopterin biosynthesis protein
MKNRVRSKLSEIRTSRGLSAAEIAKRVGVTRQTIYAIEAGNYVPNTEVALRLARELEVSVEELFALDQRLEQGVASMPAELLSTSKAAKGQAVRLGQVGTKWVSVPVSASPYFLPEADGVLTDRNRVAVFPSDGAARKRIVLAGCDPATSLLAHMVEKGAGVEVVHAPASSELALRWLKEGKVHIAGSHLEDPKTAEFNLPFIHREFGTEEIGVVTFAEWEEGFVVVRRNPKNIRSVGDLQRKNVWFMNRQPGSGSRLLIDKLLKEGGVSARSVQGYARVAAGHLAAAYAVVSGDADCCLATRSAARAFGLGFVPLHSERYDFVFRRSTLESPAVQTFMDVLQRSSLRRKLETLAGYDTSKTGTRIA